MCLYRYFFKIVRAGLARWFYGIFSHDFPSSKPWCKTAIGVPELCWLPDALDSASWILIGVPRLIKDTTCPTYKTISVPMFWQLRHQCWCSRFALALLACDWYRHLSHFAHHPIFYLWKSPLIGPGCFVARLLGGLGLNCLALSLGTMPNQPRPNMMALLEDPYILVQGSPAQLWWAEFPRKTSSNIIRVIIVLWLKSLRS